MFIIWNILLQVAKVPTIEIDRSFVLDRIPHNLCIGHTACTSTVPKEVEASGEVRHVRRAAGAGMEHCGEAARGGLHLLWV